MEKIIEYKGKIAKIFTEQNDFRFTSGFGFDEDIWKIVEIKSDYYNAKIKLEDENPNIYENLFIKYFQIEIDKNGKDR